FYGTSISELQSKLVSHALEIPTDISELYSSADVGYDNVTSEIASHVLATSVSDSELQSKLVSHVLEQSQVLSQIESSADTVEPGHSDIESEIASHVLDSTCEST
ncbi:unnamed protein product, partial [marine sediment metagenome]